MSEDRTMPEESHEPFAGDRGWKGLARESGEGLAFAIVVVLLAIAAGAALIGGVAGVAMVFVALTFISLAVLIVISMGG